MTDERDDNNTHNTKDEKQLVNDTAMYANAEQSTHVTIQKATYHGVQSFQTLHYTNTGVQEETVVVEEIYRENGYTEERFSMVHCEHDERAMIRAVRKILRPSSAPKTLQYRIHKSLCHLEDKE